MKPASEYSRYIKTSQWVRQKPYCADTKRGIRFNAKIYPEVLIHFDRTLSTGKEG